ncbi:hypothetical protein LSM04_005091 [Trypanosoma melophagium]|uniref:uncharacterized protein n=1 Tax=Trypanosoma melophagium TaxID=715481 RepID=UPI00351A82F8|nr:hypothetical protein LSM04_005091 [Trypanosoma melophagium]
MMGYQRKLDIQDWIRQQNTVVFFRSHIRKVTEGIITGNIQKHATQLHQRQRIFPSSTLSPRTTSIKDVTITPAPSQDPYIVALASEDNRVAKRIWPRTTWEERGSIIRRFIDFTVQHNLEVTEENIPLFALSLQLAKNGAIQYTRTMITMLASGRTPTQMFLADLQKTAAADPIKQARPMLRWELDTISDALPKKRDRVALRLARVTASRLGRNSSAPKTKFCTTGTKPRCHNIGWGGLPKNIHDRSAKGSERGAGTRRGSSSRTRSRPTTPSTARGKRRPLGPLKKHGAISRQLGRSRKQASATDIIDAKDLEKWAIPEPVKQVVCAPFRGHNMLRRSHRTRVATKEKEEQLPLQRIDVGTLPNKWVRERLNNKARRVWDEAPRTAQKHRSTFEGM